MDGLQVALTLGISGITGTGGNQDLAHAHNISFCTVDRYYPRRGCPCSCTHLTVAPVETEVGVVSPALCLSRLWYLPRLQPW